MRGSGRPFVSADVSGRGQEGQQPAGCTQGTLVYSDMGVSQANNQVVLDRLWTAPVDSGELDLHAARQRGLSDRSPLAERGGATSPS